MDERGEREERDGPCSHAYSADYEDGLAAEFVNVQDCGDSGEEDNDADDAGGEQRDGVA